MAQAARLNLRMQKELKLLLTDPPPGVSFPSLSDVSSITSIDADFRGPEGTVYANGVFKINIQIPERYPFQPPIVAFATPIYHPNIDNGGRICLDILNLPPKGSWQPSLNISAVLTSIGFLLRAPNPDDGLAHEASRDYKYNRQAFDQNARSMTEKYATAGERESARRSHGNQIYTGPVTEQTEMKGSDASNSIGVTEHLGSHKRFSGSSSKLSLRSLGSNSNWVNGKGIYNDPIHENLENHTEIGRLNEAKEIAAEYIRNPDKLQAPKYKLSLKVLDVSHSRHGDSPKTYLPIQLETQTPSTDSPESFPLEQVENDHEQAVLGDEYCNERSRGIGAGQEKQSSQYLKSSQRSAESSEKLYHLPWPAVSQLDSTMSHQALSWPVSTIHNEINYHKDAIDRNGNGSTSITHEEVGLVGTIPSLGPLGGCSQPHLEDEKENQAPFRHLLPQLTNPSAASPMISSVVSENGMYFNEKSERQRVIAALKLSGMAAKLLLKPLHQLRGSNNDLDLHSENPSTPHFKVLQVANDVRFDDKQQVNEVHDGEDVIVLDSEDSEDETVHVRSKLSLAQKRVSRKRKSNN